ncbi:hypothetical protein SKPI104516_10865 [Skermania piniformis]
MSVGTGAGPTGGGIEVVRPVPSDVEQAGDLGRRLRQRRSNQVTRRADSTAGRGAEPGCSPRAIGIRTALPHSVQEPS